MTNKTANGDGEREYKQKVHPGRDGGGKGGMRDTSPSAPMPTATLLKLLTDSSRRLANTRIAMLDTWSPITQAGLECRVDDGNASRGDVASVGSGRGDVPRKGQASR